MTAPQQSVPVRAILTAIGLVLATAVSVLFVMRVEKVLVWLLVSLFLATTLWPFVELVQSRLRAPRPLAVLTVFVVVGVVTAGVIALLIFPLVTQGRQFADHLPSYIDQAKHGNGPVGDVVHRFHIDTYVEEHKTELRHQALGLGTSATRLLTSVASTLAATVSIMVLTFLMLLEGPQLLSAGLSSLPEQHRQRVERVGRDCARSVTGYMAGNLLISLICGVLTYVVLALLGVRYPAVIAVFIALTDLIPLIGASIGAVVGGGVAFLHSITAGVVSIIFFIVYQLVENHLLQPVVLSRAVKINPLVVLVSVLLGVELAGILGALLAIPVAGIVQVLARELHGSRRLECVQSAHVASSDEAGHERRPEDFLERRQPARAQR